MKNVFDKNGNIISDLSELKTFPKRLYDERGKIIYFENSDGFWRKYEYDERGNKIYYKDSNGVWAKYEYDENGKQTYFENSNGYWAKEEYDERGNEIYYEDSNGVKRGNKPIRKKVRVNGGKKNSTKEEKKSLMKEVKVIGENLNTTKEEKNLSLTTDVFIESSEDIIILNSIATKIGIAIEIVKDHKRQSGYAITIKANKKKRIKKFLLKAEFACEEDLQEFMKDVKEISEDCIEDLVNENLKFEIPSLNIMSSEPMELISGVRKNGSFYIVVHGTSPNDIKDFVKIPDSVIESSKNSGDKNDIAAVIQFAMENFKKMVY